MVKRFDFVPTPQNCDLCQVTMSTEPGTMMYDAMGPQGIWVCFCADCFQRYGMRLGTGFGQSYEREADGRFWYRKG